MTSRPLGGSEVADIRPCFRTVRIRKSAAAARVVMRAVIGIRAIEQFVDSGEGGWFYS